SNIGGINYSDNWSEDVEVNGSYSYTDSDTKNNNRTVQQNLLPDNTYTTESVTKSRDQSFNHNFTTNFEVEIDSTSRIQFEPGYVYNKTKSFRDFDKFSVNEFGDLLNESNGSDSEEQTKQSFSNSINFFKSFKNKTQLSIDISNKNSRDKSDGINISNTYFYQTGDDDDIRNQYTKVRNKNDEYEFNLEYEFPVLDSVKLAIGAEYTIRNSKDDNFTYDYDAVSADYLNQNEFLSYQLSSDFNSVNPFATFKLRKKKFNASISGGVEFLTQKNNGFYRAQDYYLKQNYALPSFSANGNYRMGKGSSVYVSYNYEINLPSAQQILPIENLSNPLHTYVGNPDLEPTKTHSIYAGWNNFNFQTKTGYNLNLGGNYEETGSTNYRIIDENCATTYTYRNINGNYYLWRGFNLNKSFTKDRNKFRIGGGISVNHSHNKGFVDGEEFISKNYSISPRVNFNWDLGEILSINPSYNLRYQFNQYENYRIDES